MTRQSLRVRLLAIVLIAIVAIAAAEALVSTWGLARVRNLATDSSAQVLQQRTAAYLQTVAQGYASSIDQSVGTTQHWASLTRDYLSEAERSQITVRLVDFRRAQDGWRYHAGATTTLLPPGDDDDQMATKLAGSQNLETLMPGMARQSPEIARVSFLTTYGAMRTYPPIDPAALPPGWSVQNDEAYRAALENQSLRRAWSGIHPGLGTSAQVISAVAPVFQGDTFAGALAIDLNLNYYNNYIKHIVAEQSGFAFIVDSQGRLVAAPELGQLALLGRPLAPREQGAIDLGQALPQLDPLLGQMRKTGSGTGTANIRDRSYLVAYASIDRLGWSLALAAPVDEITASTNDLSIQIGDVAADTSRLGLAASIVAVALLAVLLSLVLGHQIIHPLTSLVAATKAIAAGDLRPIAIRRGDEIGQLARSFNLMAESVAASRAELIAANQQLECKVDERTADLHMAVAKLEETSASQQELLATLRAVSTPVIPVVAGVLAMPLVGQIDQERAQNMTAALLERIERERARMVLLDITGVPLIDTHVAQLLLELVAACRLLGAQVVLVGVAPEVAQTIVTLGIDLRGLRTAADLRTAVEQILSRR